ncbi:MAG TPA: DUF4852 domain-containing protein [Alphaproteobacteria bacterium]|nr:DUF4852 domain-containing protein [Alphaproteobacteria bacterium]HNS44847.1 DUF4852 domain-containing protein [Alphaproteobacteria bacterium]
MFLKKKSVSLTLILGGVFLFGPLQSTMAQEGKGSAEKGQSSAGTEYRDLTPVPSPSGKKLGDQIHYVETSYSNINKLLWLLGVYKTDNKEDVESYIKISECNLYLKYYRDDFEWRKVLLASQSYLEKYSPGFSNYFEIVQPLRIDRYDFDLKGFMLDPPGELANVGALQMYGMSGGSNTECGNIAVGSAKYTGSAVLKLKSPINISYIRIDPELAKEYLRYIEGKQGDLNDKPAYIRYRVRVDRYITTQNIDRVGRSHIFSGKVLQVDIFADREMFLPLFSQNFQ